MCRTEKGRGNYIRTSDYTPEQIMQALTEGQDHIEPLHEMIACTEAVFELIRQSNFELPVKNAYYQLEKQFEFYRNMLQQ